MTDPRPSGAVPGAVPDVAADAVPDIATVPRTALRTAALTTGVLVCFAANSLLCRAALGRALADPAAFTAVRLGSGAVSLALLLAMSRRVRPHGGSWASAFVLVAYAVTFSLAYARITASVGALVLFAAVQATMVGYAVGKGVRLSPVRWGGIALATAGLAWLTLPGAETPDLGGTALMALSGIGWGVYSLRGATATDPIATSADNFARSAPLALVFLAIQAAAGRVHATSEGVALAAVSGALASGGGYVLWYALLPVLGPSRAGTLQLAVPVIAAGGAVILLGEPVTLRLGSAGLAILAGVALAVTRGREARSRPRAAVNAS